MRLARRRFSALQRAEIAEIDIVDVDRTDDWGFSALQRAEIAEMRCSQHVARPARPRFSALQRAEIAEMLRQIGAAAVNLAFQCSSTSRNC